MPTSQSAASVIKVIDGLTLKNNGVFYRFDSTSQPW